MALKRDICIEVRIKQKRYESERRRLNLKYLNWVEPKEETAPAPPETKKSEVD